MPEVSEHRVTAATWEYLTPAGTRRRAFFGQTVTLTDEEVARGLNVGALGVELPAESTNDGSDSAETVATGDGRDGDPNPAAGDPFDPDAADGDPEVAGEGTGSEGDAARDKPLKAATKPVLVDWLMDNGTYDRTELEDQDKADLWALIEATD